LEERQMKSNKKIEIEGERDRERTKGREGDAERRELRRERGR
jgi:hypothetical protein